MKKMIIFKLSWVILALLFSGCKSSENAEIKSGNVAYVSNDGRETISLRSIDYGKNEEEAVKNAERQAFQNLFFRGIPNSPYKDPLLGIDEREQYHKNKDYLNEFYEDRMYTFINTSYETISKEKQGTKATVNLTINMRALRKDLQEKSLMPKFGI